MSARVAERAAKFNQEMARRAPESFTAEGVQTLRSQVAEDLGVRELLTRTRDTIATSDDRDHDDDHPDALHQKLQDELVAKETAAEKAQLALDEKLARRIQKHERQCSDTLFDFDDSQSVASKRKASRSPVAPEPDTLPDEDGEAEAAAAKAARKEAKRRRREEAAAEAAAAAAEEAAAAERKRLRKLRKAERLAAEEQLAEEAARVEAEAAEAKRRRKEDKKAARDAQAAEDGDDVAREIKRERKRSNEMAAKAKDLRDFEAELQKGAEDEAMEERQQMKKKLACDMRGDQGAAGASSSAPTSVPGTPSVLEADMDAKSSSEKVPFRAQDARVVEPIKNSRLERPPPIMDSDSLLTRKLKVAQANLAAKTFAEKVEYWQGDQWKCNPADGGLNRSFWICSLICPEVSDVLSRDAVPSVYSELSWLSCLLPGGAISEGCIRNTAVFGDIPMGTQKREARNPP